MKKVSTRITADDFEAGQKMMVSRSRRRQAGEGQPCIEFMLQGAVIEIIALNLPFVLASASCPMRGRTELIIDIRDHEFIRVSSDFANAVFESAQPVSEHLDELDEVLN